jgi:hypothetical protein
MERASTSTSDFSNRPDYWAIAERTKRPQRSLRAFSFLMESEAGLYDFDLTRFLYANRYPLRSKTL